MLLDVRPKPTLRASGANLDCETLMGAAGLQGGGGAWGSWGMQERLKQNDGVCNGSLVFSGSFTSSLLLLAWRGGRGGGALILRTMGRRTMSCRRTIEGMLFFMRL